MHMADALLSPAVGSTMWAVTAGTIAYCSRKVKVELDDSKVPLMGVLAAFIFAAQMINFTIPGTGSSGHLGGGMILAILLGPEAAFLAMASVLTVQALFFADGGLLALGCNIFNLAVFPCFIAYPLIYKRIVGTRPSEKRIFTGALFSAVLSLQLGALGVVLETVVSGVSDLPFKTFVLLMQPIHLAIGIVEGLVTSAVVLFIWRARPEILQYAAAARPLRGVALNKVLAGLLVATLVTGGALSWFASTNPDGLEWAIAKVPGNAELKGVPHGIQTLLASVQTKMALLPNYNFVPVEKGAGPKAAAAESGVTWPAVDAGKTASGLLGGALTLGMAAVIGLFLKRRMRTKPA